MYEERPSLLRGAVVWTREDTSGGSGRVLPDGCMDLLLWGEELVVAGPDTRAHLVSGEAGSRACGLRFAPGTAPLVLGVRAWELCDQRVPLAALWPEREVRELTERAAGAPDPGAVLEALAQERLRRREAGGEAGGAGGAALSGGADSVRGAVVAGLRRGLGVAQVATSVGLSERQLHRRCRDAFGYGPKTLARVLRMRGALRLAHSGRPPAEIAPAVGYADQAHLAREFRALAGAPLTELIRTRAGAAS
ncbi:helix-turn-helix transcriptional regulator [Streptomyces daliensis]|uniref:Helix-turn-helix transcriptional regulator n=1 Tax=Streptomyces daliensis TaxID=299421 RepID=A0A8T4IW83_9ACTN|nr:helix-turn-helix transcriptional regulator [Streptomyces daliensis]